VEQPIACGEKTIYLSEIKHQKMDLHKKIENTIRWKNNNSTGGGLGFLSFFRKERKK
jgi:hypothetical protein